LGTISAFACKDRGKKQENLCRDGRLKPKLVQIAFKNSVHNSKRALPVTVTNINLLKLLKEIIAVYPEISTRPTNKNADFLVVKAAGTYSYHSALKD
jgi:hypothetical protein